jgi:hypothetical protein
MQDRKPQLDENLLQRTAGPYIGVNRVGLAVHRSLPIYPANGDRQTGRVVRFVPNRDIRAGLDGQKKAALRRLQH